MAFQKEHKHLAPEHKGGAQARGFTGLVLQQQAQNRTLALVAHLVSQSAAIIAP